MDRVSLYQILFNFIIWVFLLLVSYKHIYRTTSSSLGYMGLFCILLVFSAYGFCTGDYLNYKNLYNEIIRYDTNQHLEPIYYWLIKTLPSDYHLWRAVVWGVAALFLILTYKKLRLPTGFTIMTFVVVLMPIFPNLRNALGYVVVLLALAFLMTDTNQKRFLSIFLSVALFLVSLFLHKTMFVYVVIALFSCVPINRRLFYTVALLVFPILYVYVYNISDMFIDFFATDDLSANTGKDYLNSEFQTYSTIFGLFQLAINRLPILFLLFYMIKNSVYSNDLNMPKHYFVYLKYTFILIYISFLFYGQSVSSYLSPRFWDASLFPLTILIPEYFGMYGRPRYFKVCMTLLILAAMFNFAYAVYKVM